MGPLRRRDRDGRPPGMVDELETMLKRAAFLPLTVPILLLVGWMLGEVAARGISLPDGAPASVAAAPYGSRAQLEDLSDYMHTLRTDGEHAEEYVLLYNNHVRPVEASLGQWGIDRDLARRVAWPLVEHSYARGLDPATVAAVVLVESSGRPSATSFVGARGLMQVMPVHLGHWDCGRDLYDIEVNLCYGTSILAANLRRFRGDEQRALLAYNGCVNGANTPDCHTYPSKVARMRDQVRSEWRKVAPRSYEALLMGSTSPAAAAP